MSDLGVRESRPAAGRHWLDNPVESGRRAGFGVYVHVPFCSHRCGYCDFATRVAEPERVDDEMRGYVDALCRDIDRVAAGGRDGGAWPRVTSVFIGGGTPTLLPRQLLASLVQRVTERFELAAGAEITVEANPETVTPAMFATLSEVGVTRVSLGAQSFVPHVLATLERQHGPDRPVEAVAEARAAGMAHVSLDLIYATPGESLADWVASLTRAVTADVDHLSAYALSIHANTPFGRRVANQRLAPVDDDAAADRFEVAREFLAAAGFDHYELSNWSRGPEARSAHNVLYWRHGDYLAFGVGAHGHLDGRRWWNPRSVLQWQEAVDEGRDPSAGSEVVEPEARRLERLLLGLRLRDGLHPADVPPLLPGALDDTVAAGLVEVACGRVRCTDRGWYLLDEAVRRLA